MHIKVYREETYPIELKKTRKTLSSHNDYVICNPDSCINLIDYLEDKRWSPNHPTGKLIDDIAKILAQHSIVVYHNTRQVGKESVLNHGLVFSDKYYLNNLSTTYMENCIDLAIVEEIMSAVHKELYRGNLNIQTGRGKQICYYYDFKDHLAYDSHLAVFGGELVNFGLCTIEDPVPQKFHSAVTLGNPYIVEFLIPATWLTTLELTTIAMRMLAIWVTEDVRQQKSDFIFESSINREIPPENIIALYLVNENFDMFYKDYFNQTK